MKKMFEIAVLLACFLAIAMTSQATAADTINGAGASFPYPVYSAWAYDYQAATGTQINYQSIGSGGGVKQIEARTVDFGASDDPLTADAIEKLKVYQFPAVIGGVVPVVNLPGIAGGSLRLTPETLCGIFLGTITSWDDKALVADNPGTRLPGEKITVVHRSDGSGTTAIFTAYLAGVCPDWKTKVGKGKAVDWPVGIGGKGNEGVANYVQRTKGAIGYVELAYAKSNKLTSVRLRNGAGNFVEPSIESFRAAAAGADFDPKKHFELWLVNAPGKDSWPIAGATFILLGREKTEANRKVVKFFDWAFKSGDKTAEGLIYVPLPASLKDKVRGYWKAAGIQ